jgi:PAS domain S-box-containing protein
VQNNAALEAISLIADQLCGTIDDDFDLRIDVDTDDEQVLKLVMMVNFLLDRVRRTIGHLTDVQQHLEQRVEERTAELNLVIDGSNDGVWVWNLHDDRVIFSRRWRETIGSGEGGIQPPDFWFAQVHPKDRARLRAAIAAHLDGLQPLLNIEYRIRHASGMYRRVLCRGLARRDSQGRPQLFAGTQSDITELRCIDPVSGLPNEHSFEEMLGDLIDSAEPACVAILSVDRMAALGETQDSHSLGDFRSDVRLRLQSHLPVLAVLAQLPGDQFGIILRGTSGETATGKLLPTLCDAFSEPVPLRGSGPQWLSLSIGVVDLRATGAQDVEDLLGKCWSALNAARRNPDRPIQAYHPALREEAEQRLVIENTVRAAITEGRLEAFFQPVVATGTGELRGFEALVRARDAAGALLSPAQFIPVIESSELIVTVGKEMLRQSLQRFASWRAAGWIGEQVFLSINLAARQLARPDLPAQVDAALQATGVPPHCVKLEVTETALVADLDQAIAALNALRRTGVRISLDDFGTGYSSLEYLNRLPIDVLKIDRSFVQQIDRVDSARAIAATVCSLARLLGLDVVAEGVETRTQEQLLADMQVPMIQGYLYSRPLPPDDIDSGLLQRLREVPP